MSLVKSPELTEKKLESCRRNAARSRGPATVEGRERQRASRLRHGLYAQEEDAAVRVLGEDPAELGELRAELRQKWQPSDGFEERLVERLARAMWRAERADRMQEGAALGQAKKQNRRRDGRLHARLMRLKIAADTLKLLAEHASQPRYVATSEDIKKMQAILADGLITKPVGEVMLAFLQQLKDPQEDDPILEMRCREVFMRMEGVMGPPLNLEEYTNTAEEAGASAQEEAKEKVEDYPGISAEDWVAREPLRQLLENILKRQVRECEAERQALLRESLAGPSIYERAAEIAPTQDEALAAYRLEESNFRQIWRLTNLLLKLKSQEQRGAKKIAGLSDDVYENKGLKKRQKGLSDDLDEKSASYPRNPMMLLKT